MSNILVVGAGSIGKRHIKNLLTAGVEASNIHVIEPRADRESEVAELGINKDNIFQKRDEALNKVDFDGAVIASPTVFHYEDAIACASKGINLMIEKPVDVDLSRYEELDKIITDNKLFAFTAYCFRFDEVANCYKDAMSKTELGKPLYARAEMSTYLPDWHPWEDYRDFYMSKKELGGGTLLDQSHLYDMTCWFLGDITHITGISTKYSDLEINTDDFGEMIFQMKSGIYVSVHIDLFTKVARRFYQTTFENGTLEWDINNKKVIMQLAGKDPEVLIEREDYNQMYINEINYFLEGVKQGPSIEGPKMIDGKKAMDVVCAVRESKGNALIKVS